MLRLPNDVPRWHTDEKPMGRPFKVGAKWQMLLLAAPLLVFVVGCSALPLAAPTPPAVLPANLAASGDQAVSGYQQESWIYDRVIITYNTAPALTGRLRIIDRGANFEGRLGEREVSSVCTTFNGLTLELDCRVCAAGTEEQACKSSAEPIAHLRIPLH